MDNKSRALFVLIVLVYDSTSKRKTLLNKHKKLKQIELDYVFDLREIYGDIFTFISLSY